MSDNARNFRLVEVLGLDTETLLKIREIRNQTQVRKWMYTDHEIGANEHLNWISSLRQDAKQVVFAVLNQEGVPVGVVSLNAIDRLHMKADWAYYLSECERGGLGSAIEYTFVDFAFNIFGLSKLNCEVIEGNDAVVKLHKKFLFQEEGFRRCNILKNGIRIGVHFLGLTKEDWLEGKADVYDRYKRVFQKFPVSVQWEPTETRSKHPIELIEDARARNNLNWMSILRLAIEKSPSTASPIVAEIRRIDREIAGLTDKLIDEDS